MNCAEVQSLLHAFADGELDLVHSTEVEQHLHECPRCEASLAAIRSLSSAVASRASYHRAPEGLARQIRFVAGTEAATQRARPAMIARYWLAAAAALLLVLTGWLAIHAMRGGDMATVLAQEVVSGHIRSLMVAGHLTDVLSSDQHTVKPWFESKLDFAPPVQDLATKGFVLEGGRLDYIQQRPVAALVYSYRKHPINLFIWPAGSGEATAPAASSRDGYALIHWQQGGMTFWAVSDASADVVREFVAAVRGENATATRP